MPYCMDYAHIHVPLCKILTSFLHANTMDLSDISNFEDIMIASSDKDILALKDAPYWKDWFELKHYIDFNLFN